MAAEESPRKLPFGASPYTLVVIAVGLVGVAAYFLYPLMMGEGVEKTGSQVAGDARTPAKVLQASAGAKTDDISRIEDEFSSFLVRFGRANPFALVSAGAKPRAAGQAGATEPAADSALEKLRSRLENLQAGQPAGDAGSSAATNSGATAAGTSTTLPSGTGTNAPAQEPFVLKGLVRLGDKVIALVCQGTKRYLAKPGDPLGKTGYVVRTIQDEQVVLVSTEGEESVLSLRRKKP